MSKYLVFWVAIAGVASLGAVTAPALSQYRGVTLGDSVAAVTERLQLIPANLKVLYAEPTLIQEATWRPNAVVSGSVATADPLAEVVLTFHQNRLTRIVAIYDRERTQGLTDADLLELFGGVYGVPLLGSTSVSPVLAAVASRRLLAHWADSDALVVLWREDYPRRIGLTLTSTGDELLQQAMNDGARQRVAGAPERLRAEQAAAAAAIKDRDERTRLENKAKFKP